MPTIPPPRSSTPVDASRYLPKILPHNTSTHERLAHNTPTGLRRPSVNLVLMMAQYKVQNIKLYPSLSQTFMVAQGTQFWAPEYLRVVYFAGDPSGESKILCANVVIAGTAPVLGIYLGGRIVDDVLGGYAGLESRIRAYKFLMVCGCISTWAGLTASTLSGEKNFLLACSLLWILLAVGSAAVGPFQGIAIDSIEDKQVRTLANSLSQVRRRRAGTSTSTPVLEPIGHFGETVLNRITPPPLANTNQPQQLHPDLNN